MNAARALLVGSAAAILVACAGEGPRAESANRLAIARVHESKCGACHAPPERGTRARDALEAAFGRHRSQNRVRLSPSEWTDMVDYLSDQNSRRAAITR